MARQPTCVGHEMNKLLAALALTGAALFGAGVAHADPRPNLGDDCTVLGAVTTDNQNQMVECVKLPDPNHTGPHYIWVLLGAVE